MYGLPEQIICRINFGGIFDEVVCQMAGCANRIKFGTFKDLFMCLSLYEAQYYMTLQNADLEQIVEVL